MIAIVDYGMGNLRSVQNAFSKLGRETVVTSDPHDIDSAARLVLPGVGAFDHAVEELHKRKLFNPIKKSIIAGKPYLGLCLGLQLLFESSDEGSLKGFSIIEGSVVRFQNNLKVPHMGWNQVEFAGGKCPYWKDVPDGTFFYFVHSFYVKPKDEALNAGLTDYGIKFTSAIRKDNIFATQFHPEKSQRNGLKVLKNFMDIKS